MSILVYETPSKIWWTGIKVNCPKALNEGIIKDDLNNPSNTSLASFCSFKVKEFCQLSISSINSTLPCS